MFASRTARIYGRSLFNMLKEASNGREVRIVGDHIPKDAAWTGAVHVDDDRGLAELNIVSRSWPDDAPATLELGWQIRHTNTGRASDWGMTNPLTIT